MGSFMGRGSQYTQLVKVLYCKLPTMWWRQKLSSSNVAGSYLNIFFVISTFPYEVEIFLPIL